MSTTESIARRAELDAAADAVIELAGELADWYDRSGRHHDLGCGDRDAMLKALSTAVGRLRRIANGQ